MGIINTIAFPHLLVVVGVKFYPTNQIGLIIWTDLVHKRSKISFRLEIVLTPAIGLPSL